MAGPPSPVLPEAPVPAMGVTLPGSQAVATIATTATTPKARRSDVECFPRVRMAGTLVRSCGAVSAGVLVGEAVADAGGGAGGDRGVGQVVAK